MAEKRGTPDADRMIRYAEERRQRDQRAKGLGCLLVVVALLGSTLILLSGWPPAWVIGGIVACWLIAASVLATYNARRLR